MSNPVSWFEIYVQDSSRARQFYETVLGSTLTRLPTADLEMWAFDMNDQGYGASGALVHMPGMPSGGNSTLVYFACADCAVEAARIEPAGGQLSKPKFSIGPYGFIALGCDTDGNMFGLHSMQ